MNDTDAGGLLDGAEPSPFSDSDSDGTINARDGDSNGDGIGDLSQVWVAFRMNATNGSCGVPGTWVSVLAPRENPYYAAQIDFSAGSALYLWDSEVASPNGSQIWNPYGPSNDTNNTVPLFTPEGYPVLAHQNGSTYDIYIKVSDAKTEKFLKSSAAPSDYNTSNRSADTFLARHQEVMDGRAALGNDTDFDGISNVAEIACGLNVSSNDTDGDGIPDGIEFRGCVDTDKDGKPDARDKDSDNDGVPDGTEDANKNGVVDPGRSEE